MQLDCILIVDDCKSDQYICQMLLEETCPNVKLTQAFDGEEALEILQSSIQKPDLILLDINMPRMNGLEFLTEYNKQDETQKTATIVVLTSSTHPKDKDSALAYNFVIDYLTKPLSVEDINKLKNL